MIHLSMIFRCSSSVRPFIITRGVAGRSYEDLLARAKALEDTYQIARAQKLYWEIMDKYPTQEEGYQRLWNIWVETCSLRVTEQEMEGFIARYTKYIDPGQK